MNIVFRTDASIEIGTGHVMRCLTIADKFSQATKASVSFVCREHSGNLISTIKNRGYRVHTLPIALEERNSALSGDYIEWVGADIEIDATETANILFSEKANLLVVDHFGISSYWETFVRQRLHYPLKIMVIDGQANRKHDCDVLLDPTYCDDANARWQPLVPATCQIFAGPQYAPLRSEFDQYSSKLISSSDDVRKRLLITFGGVDKPNASEKVLRLIKKYHLDLEIGVLVGAQNPHLKTLSKLTENYPNIKIHVDPPSVPELMSKADIAVTAGGTTVWELCKLGIPMLIITIADNQVHLANSLDQIGAAIYVGDFDDLKDESFISALSKVKKPDMALKLSKNSQSLMQRSKTGPIEYLLNEAI